MRKRGYENREREDRLLHWPERPGVVDRVVRLQQLDELKNRLLQQYICRLPEMEYVPAVHRAVEEAAALAWSTPVPHLFLPELLAEKVAGAKEWVDRQRKIRERSRQIISFSE